eukprot:c12762_g1_i2.p1 GENE.c12762_g1_i2~~c12762_g1_i2.p1  ORF type:complete len:436 (+),score=85.96 c12762_g1_i2:133-1308(+)
MDYHDSRPIPPTTSDSQFCFSHSDSLSSDLFYPIPSIMPVSSVYDPTETPPRIYPDILTVVGENDLSQERIVLYKTKKVKQLAGKYVYGPTLGQGSYGKVKEGMEMKSGRRVAVKIVHNKDIEKARAELTIQRHIAHANITAVLDVIKPPHKDKTFIVFELLPYRDLETVLKKMPRNRLPSKIARKFFRDLIEGMSFLHSKGIIHRDIKPDNLMIAADGTLKISDFGVSFHCTHFDNELCRSSPGSLSFQPPEIVRAVDPLCSVYHLDLWAAGVTLYRMLYGALPFVGINQELTQNIQRASPPFPTDDWVDPLAEELVRSMLAREPNERMSLDDIMLHKWMQAQISPEHEDSLFLDYVKEIGLSTESATGALDKWLEAIPDDQLNGVGELE